jgi:hypothetical protein
MVCDNWSLVGLVILFILWVYASEHYRLTRELLQQTQERHRKQEQTVQKILSMVRLGLLFGSKVSTDDIVDFAKRYCGMKEHTTRRAAVLFIRKYVTPKTVKNEPGDQECTICASTQVKIYACVPCGHTLCMECMLKLTACPYCDRNIEEHIPLYV